MTDSVSKFEYDIYKNKLLRGAGVISVAALAALSYFTVCPVYTYLVETEATTGTAAQSTTTLTITNSAATAAVDLSVTSKDGTFAASSSDVNFSVKTDNYKGYTLSLAPKVSDSTDLTNNIKNENDDSYAAFTTLSENTTENDFASRTSYNGFWGIKPSKFVSGTSTVDNSASDGTAVYLPASAIKIDKTSAGNNSSANNYTIGIGARASYSQAAGTYSNTYVLTAIGNAISYEIAYDKSTTDDVSNMPYADNNYKQAGEPTATAITLSDLVPERNGYNFKGWCSVVPTDNDTSDPSCSGTIYNQNGDGSNLIYGIDYTGSNSATIYAMWIKVTNRFNDVAYMQKFTMQDCIDTTDGQNGSLIDSRDNQTYTVVKLDGRCIMTQNLNYIGGSNGTENAGAAVASNGGNFTMTSSTNSSYSSPFYYRSSNSSYGTYYNYCAASGASVCTNTNTAGPSPATASICPSGWRLPTSDSSTSFGGISTRSLLSSGNLAVYAGVYNKGTLYDDTTQGRWWSSIADASSGESVRYVLLHSTSGVVNAQSNGDGRNDLLSVRCVKNDDGYMQDVTQAQVNAISDGGQLTLADRRDEQIYTARKVGDTLWMTRNLAIGCNGIGATYGSDISSISLTSNLSNVSEAWSTPTTSLTSGNDYSDPRMACSETYGAWYNYAATTAGTITGDANGTDATYDICPSGWRLFTNDERAALINNIGDAANFNPVLGGYYNNGTIQEDTADVFWWSSATLGAYTLRRTLNYNGIKLSETNYYRNYGLYVRCVYSGPSGYMQNVTISQIASMNEGDTLWLADLRDLKTYSVKKINGQLWMTQNLRFQGTSFRTTTSNVTSNRTMTYYDLAGAEGTSDSGHCHGSGNSGNGNLYACEHYSGDSVTGVWYNYAAATAMTVVGVSNSSVATEDVCPKNWHLPSGPNKTSGTDVNKLIGNTTSGYQDVTDGMTAFGIVTGGYYAKGVLFAPTDAGNWWTATAYNNDNAYSRYYLQYNANFGINGSTNNTRYAGYYVRCVADPPTIAKATYMQDVTNDMVKNTENGTTKSLIDSRDGQVYTVRKVGTLLWMTRNLAIGCNGSGSAYGSSISSVTLTSANSNVSAAWSTPTTSLASGDDYSDPRMACDSTYGAWYNYAAATAGTITGDSNSDIAVYSICPSGWRLFSTGERTNLMNNIGDINNFNPVYGGYYTGGRILSASSYGIWWSSVVYAESSRNQLFYNKGALSAGLFDRTAGTYVRCIHR